MVEYPERHPTGEALPCLVDLVDPDGPVKVVELADPTGEGSTGLVVFEGAASGLLGQDDIEEAGKAIGPGRPRPS